MLVIYLTTLHVLLVILNDTVAEYQKVLNQRSFSYCTYTVFSVFRTMVSHVLHKSKIILFWIVTRANCRLHAYSWSYPHIRFLTHFVVTMQRLLAIQRQRMSFSTCSYSLYWQPSLSKTVQSYHNFTESALLEFEIFRKK
jgi:hypothetical protein